MDFFSRLIFSGSVLFAGFLVAGAKQAPFEAGPTTRVAFQSDDIDLQHLHDAAVARLQENLVPFTESMQVLVEGGGYPNAWLETQPMGGEMFAKRNLQVGLNNQVIFMLTQREDGRLPGMVIAGDTARARVWDEQPPEAHLWMPEVDMLADFEMFQGFCFPEPAWRIYHWMGRDRDYLRRLYAVLEGYDAYLWKTRDSNGDGVLETWCVWDTGEDASTRLEKRLAPNRWPFDEPPGAEGMPTPENPEDLRRYWHQRPSDPMPEAEQVRVPFQSMDIMAYSYSARATLAKVAAELGNGKEKHWESKAGEVRQSLIDKLWDGERKACFDRDRDGKVLPELIHNNLRCMWYGIFNQEMADAFVKHHLIDPEAFWTPVPLPSIAINEPLFYNGKRNNWSGQPQGLTYQRAIDALENYGHYAEVTLLGRKLLPVLIRNNCRFTQQLDPMTGAPSGQRPDGYGPMMLAALEYITRMHGIHLEVAEGRVWWSSVDPEAADFDYEQNWGDRYYRLRHEDGMMKAYVGRELAFAATAGTRVVTDLEGKVLEVVGVAPEPVAVKLTAEGDTVEVEVAPNTVHQVDSGKATQKASVPFNLPREK
ncbi:MAG: hypothetical protein R6U56_02895 [Opitutales bacterium]